MTLDTSRHEELFESEKFVQPVWIFGVGGTGTAIARCLVGLGVGHGKSPLHLCDHDYFEPHNVPTQLVSYQQGKDHRLKVDAVRENLLFTNPFAVIHTHPVKAPDPSLGQISGVVFLCLDSMADRRTIVEEVLENNPYVTCVIDIRMDVPGALVYCFDPNDPFQVDCYFDEWYSDAEADEMLGCSDEHFAMLSSIYGAACLAMKRFEDFVENESTWGIPNYATLVYQTGHYALETWEKPDEES